MANQRFLQLNLTPGGTGMEHIPYLDDFGNLYLNGTVVSPTQTYNVRAYGAVGDGVTDDSAAFAAAWAALKAQLLSIQLVPVVLQIPPGIYAINTSINWTGGASTFLAWNVHIVGNGAILLGACAGKAVIDMTGVRGMHVSGLSIVGSSTSVPSCGLLVGARATDTCGNGQFNNLIFRGNYTKACVGNIAIETSTWRDCYFMNDSTVSTAYAYAADGAMNLGFTSDYSTLRSAGTVNSLTNNSFSGCRFSKLSAGYCIYMERTINWTFHRDNYFLGYDNAIFWLQQTTGTTNRDLRIEGLFETTGLKYIALIVCTDGATTTLRRLFIDAGLFFAQTAMIGVKRSSDLGNLTSGSCVLTGVELRADGSTTGPNTVPFFDGTFISVSGDIVCDYGAMLNMGTLADFHGTITTDNLANGTAPSSTSSAVVFERANGRTKIYGPQVLSAAGGSVSVTSTLTGTTTETVLGTVTIPAGAMGPNGYLKCRAAFSGMTSSANNKSVRFRLGGLAGSVLVSSADTTVTSAFHEAYIHNRNSQASQVGFGIANRGTDQLQQAITSATATVDTTVAQQMVVTGQLALGTETMTLDSFTVEIVYGA